MSRYMEAINLLIELKAKCDVCFREETGAHSYYIPMIDAVLAIPESPGEQAIREGDELAELAK